mgnify:CR=1 FL=1
MRNVIFTLLLVLCASYLHAGSYCSNLEVVTSGDSFEYSASIYVVCDDMSRITRIEARGLVNSTLRKYPNIANEVFIFFVTSKDYFGAMDIEPYTIPKEAYLADFYNMTNRFVLWPKVKAKQRIIKLPDK